jgi:hypothetical protein
LALFTRAFDGVPIRVPQRAAGGHVEVMGLLDARMRSFRLRTATRRSRRRSGRFRGRSKPRSPTTIRTAASGSRRIDSTRWSSRRGSARRGQGRTVATPTMPTGCSTCRATPTR